MLRGPLADEVALHGVLTKIAGLNLHLVSVNVVEAGRASSDSSAAIGHEAASVDAAPRDHVEGMLVQKKARSPRKRAPK